MTTNSVQSVAPVAAVTPRPAPSQDEWAAEVAGARGLDSPADVARVHALLTQAGVRPGGRPLTRNALEVVALYFAGIKVIKSESRDVEAHVGDPGDGVSDRPATAKTLATGVVHEPFAFSHHFQPGVTAFATDGTNEAGKSTILGILLWALRGSPPTPTLQRDIRDQWIREAAVVIQIDSARLLVRWSVDATEPSGAIYTLDSSAPIDFDVLRDAGESAAREELKGRPVDEPAPQVDAESQKADESWPAKRWADGLVDSGRATVLAAFDDEPEFESAVGELMMGRLHLDRVQTWTKLSEDIDPEDAVVVEHGWNLMRQTVSIIDPTIAAVLGETPIVTTQLLGVFLGSTWTTPTQTARIHKQRAVANLARNRRRRERDQATNMEDQEKIDEALSSARTQLGELGELPNPVDVQTAAEIANIAAIAAFRGHAELLAAAARYGEAERDRAAAERDLFALIEANSTRRFFHALRPSCCPRCDAVIDQQMWSRESAGQCSLCDRDLDIPPVSGMPARDGAESRLGSETTPDAASSEDDYEDDAESTLRLQIEHLTRSVTVLDQAHDAAREEYVALVALAAESASVLEGLDRSSSDERRQLETEIARLEGRSAERAALNDKAGVAEDADQEFARDVFASAEILAKAQRDSEQRQSLAIVSEVITELGSSFGIRNLVSAELRANGHMPVKKGESTDNFSDLSPGERLRLKIALIVGLLRAGEQTGMGRHPGLLIVDDLTSHEVQADDAARMVAALSGVAGLQFIAASTYGPTLRATIGDDRVIGPPDGKVVMF